MALAKGGFPETTYFGICRHITDEVGINGEEVVWKYSKSWPRFSGQKEYPIGGESEFNSNTNLWIGKSGKLRRSLCRHIAKCLSKKTK